MSKHQVRSRVRYAETDQMGVVYHANYLVWMEIGRVEALREHGFHYKDLEGEAGIALAVVEAQCRYIYPARYDDEILVETSCGVPARVLWSSDTKFACLAPAACLLLERRNMCG